MQIPNKPFIYKNKDGRHLLKLTKSIQSDERCLLCFFAKYLEGDYCYSHRDYLEGGEYPGNCGDDNGILYFFKHIKSKPIRHMP
jgi:hypothetical protein